MSSPSNKLLFSSASNLNTVLKAPNSLKKPPIFISTKVPKKRSIYRQIFIIKKVARKKTLQLLSKSTALKNSRFLRNTPLAEKLFKVKEKYKNPSMMKIII